MDNVGKNAVQMNWEILSLIATVLWMASKSVKAHVILYVEPMKSEIQQPVDVYAGQVLSQMMKEIV